MKSKIVDRECYTELVQAATVSIQDMVMTNIVKTEDIIYNAIMSAYGNNMIDYNTKIFFEKWHNEALKNNSVFDFYKVFMRQVQWSRETFLSVLN
jgi:hypothetical protein